MLLADNFRRQDAGGGIQRVDSRIDALGGDITAQNRGGIQVGEGRGRGRVGQVVCRHVDSLYGGDRALAGGSDTLL